MHTPLSSPHCRHGGRPTPLTPGLGQGKLTAAAALLLCALAAKAQVVTLCPNSPSLGGPGSAEAALAAAEASQSAWLAATALPPGGNVPTPGTNLVADPNLAGPLLVQQSQPFSFMTPSGAVMGMLTMSIVSGADQSCDLYYGVSVNPAAAGAVRDLTIRGYAYKPLRRLVADFRNDLPGVVAPVNATRSPGMGTTIRFHLPPGGVGAGQRSRRMLLDTRIESAAQIGTVQLRGVGGGLSALIPAYVPSPP